MKHIYLDHAATTPMRSEVREAMEPFLTERFGNPNSVHARGREARIALEEARERVASALGARPDEIVFTGGGTDADNLAVLGRSRADRRNGGSGAVVCSAIEHSAVLESGRAAAEEGTPLCVLGVDADGQVDPSALTEALAEPASVVSIMWGNNEIGSLQPISVLASISRDAGVPFHTDAVQAFGKVRVRVDETAVDLLSVSAHKIGGPKGVGALFARDGVELVPVVHGGGQERGLRAGTQDVAGAVGLGVAAELAAAEQERENARLARLRDRLEAELRARVPELQVNGGPERLPHILSLALLGTDPEPLLLSLDLEGIAASTGSACHSGAASPSHVLLAIGRPAQGEAWIRFSLGLASTDADIDEALARIPPVVGRVRDLAHA